MVNAPTTKRQNENEASQAPQESNGVEVSVEPFNPSTSMKKRKTGNAVNVAKSAFEDTLINFAEEDQLDSKGTLYPLVAQHVYNNCSNVPKR
jgi:PP-loop superfamily ATP-utilizing enzyme